MPQTGTSVIRQEGVTTSERDSLTVTSGEFWKIYNTTTSQWEYWNGVAWVGLMSSGVPEFLIIAFSDETTAIDAATDKVTFTMPNFATTLTGIAVSFVTAPTTSTITIDVNEAGTSILSTKITVDATEKTSETAATPPVISDSALAANAIMSVDVDTADSGGTSAGGKLIIYFTKT